MSEVKAPPSRWPKGLFAGALTEGAFVLFGILGAFALQAWWEAEGDRREVAGRLQAVHVELREARDGYESHLAYLDRQDSLAAAILREVERYSGSSERLDSLLFWLGPFTDFIPSRVALDDATGPGGISLIRSPELRRALAGYKTVIERGQEEQARVREAFHAEVAPLWTQYLNLRDQLAAGGMLPTAYPEVSRAPDYAGLFRDRRFANQIAERTILVNRVRGLHRSAVERIDELILLLDAFSSPDL